MPVLTAGEECQMAARSLSAFTGTGAPGTGIPKNFITMAMAIAIVRGGAGVAVVRLKTGEWSAPCAIMLENPAGDIKTEQDTVLLFMSENSVLSLVARTRMILGSTHRFACGGLVGNPIIDGSNDVYVYVRFNNTFTPANLVLSAMTGWGVREDMDRHSRWHGADVTWADVLMNKITVDRSSIGNALYLVINIAAGGSSTGVFEMNGRKNFANLEKLPVRKGLDQQGGAASPTQTATSSPAIPATSSLPQQMTPQSIQQMQITPQLFLQLQQMPPQQAQYIFQHLTPQQMQQIQQLQMYQAQAQQVQQQQMASSPAISATSYTPSNLNISSLGLSSPAFSVPQTPSYQTPTQSTYPYQVQQPPQPTTQQSFGFNSPDIHLQRHQELLTQQQQFQKQREEAEEMTRKLEMQSKQLEMQRMALEKEQEALRMGVFPGGSGGGSGGGANVQAFGGFYRQ